jgi:phospholipid/cholesterol/gamma-HCH transport system substrate-binding protein
VERDARYATVALFALACVAAAVAFVWWYSGRGDRRDFQTYEIYFEGTVSGLSKGSPVRYLGVDVGRVTALSIDRNNPRRVKVIADIDASAPVSGATQARLGFLGLATGLLYIDLQQDPSIPRQTPLEPGERFPVIHSRKGSFEASAEKLPELLGQASVIMVRVEQLLAEDNVQSIKRTLANIERTSAQAPATIAEVQALAADLRRIAASTTELTARANDTLAKVQPDVQATLANARIASEKLVRAADGIDRMLGAEDGAFGRNASASVAELQQLLIDARDASTEVRNLARELRERPSSLLREPAPSGVEMPR